jgi:hypothetical protein
MIKVDWRDFRDVVTRGKAFPPVTFENDRLFFIGNLPL